MLGQATNNSVWWRIFTSSQDSFPFSDKPLFWVAVAIGVTAVFWFEIFMWRLRRKVKLHTDEILKCPMCFKPYTGLKCNNCGFEKDFLHTCPRCTRGMAGMVCLECGYVKRLSILPQGLLVFGSPIIAIFWSSGLWRILWIALWIFGLVTSPIYLRVLQKSAYIKARKRKRAVGVGDGRRQRDSDNNDWLK